MGCMADFIGSITLEKVRFTLVLFVVPRRQLKRGKQMELLFMIGAAVFSVLQQFEIATLFVAMAIWWKL